MKAVPKHRLIFETLQKNIESGLYSPNSQLPTEQELADEFETSRPTVVKALDRLKDLGYVYRIQGKGTFVSELSGSKSLSGLSPKIVSVVLPFAEYRNVARLDETNILKGIQTRLAQCGYYTMIHYCNDNGVDFVNAINSIKTTASAGIIAYVSKDLMSCGDIYSLISDDKPFVLIDQPIIGLDLPCIHANNEQGGYHATEHLVDCGYDVVYFITDINLNFNESIRQRYIGFCKAVQDNKTDTIFNHLFITQGSEDPDVLQANIKQIIEKHQGKTIGLFCTNDYFAQRIFNSCAALNIDVPKQVGIVGFDGLGISLSNGKELTTVAQDFYKIGKRASDVMLQRLSNLPSSDIDVVVDVKLTVGTTTCDFKQTAQGE